MRGQQFSRSLLCVLLLASWYNINSVIQQTNSNVFFSSFISWKRCMPSKSYLLSTQIVGPVVVQSSKHDLSDSCWHYVKINRRKTRLKVTIDRGKTGKDNGTSSASHVKLNLNNQSNVIHYGGGLRRFYALQRPSRCRLKVFSNSFILKNLMCLMMH